VFSGYLTSVIARKVDHGQSTAANRLITFPTHHPIIISPKTLLHLTKMNALAPTFGRGFRWRLGNVLHPTAPRSAESNCSAGRLRSCRPFSLRLRPTSYSTIRYVDVRSPHRNALAVPFPATSLAVAEGLHVTIKTLHPPSKNKEQPRQKKGKSNATLRTSNASGGKMW
jgi:hypothetical protein